MKLLETYLPRMVFDQYVLLPVGQKVIENKNIIKKNETGYIIAQKLISETDYDSLLASLVEEFEATDDEIPAVKDTLDAFLAGRYAEIATAKKETRIALMHACQDTTNGKVKVISVIIICTRLFNSLK